jgi:hypothetical protein
MRTLKYFLVVTVAGLSTLFYSLAYANLLVNGSFEDPPVAVQKGFHGGTSFSGWNVSGIQSAIMNNNVGPSWTLAAIWPQAQDGSQYLYLNDWGNTNTSISQSVNLDGGTYSFSFYLNGLVNGLGTTFDYSPSVILDLSGPGGVLLATTVYGIDNRTWTAFDFDFSVATSGIYSLTFTAPSTPVLPVGQNYNFIALDHVELIASPVPEPETYAMMLAGLCLLGVMARRRKDLQQKKC